MRCASVLCVASSLLLAGCYATPPIDARVGYSTPPSVYVTHAARPRIRLARAQAPRRLVRRASVRSGRHAVYHVAAPRAHVRPHRLAGRAPAQAERKQAATAAGSAAAPAPSAVAPSSPWLAPGAAQAAEAPPAPAAPAKDEIRALTYAPTGSKTASGEAFNADFYTAAHASLPFGSRLRVSHGGKSVVVRVNDRPSASAVRRGAVLELTPRSAREIGLSREGRVTVEPAD